MSFHTQWWFWKQERQVLLSALTELLVKVSQFLCIINKSLATTLALILLYFTVLQSVWFKVPFFFCFITRAIRTRQPVTRMFLNVSVHITFIFKALIAIDVCTSKSTSTAVGEEVSLKLTLKWKVFPTGFAHKRTWFMFIPVSSKRKLVIECFIAITAIHDPVCLYVVVLQGLSGL